MEFSSVKSEMILEIFEVLTHFEWSSLGMESLFALVSIVFGSMQVTLIFNASNSLDNVLLRLINAAFDAEYADIFLYPTSPATAPILIILGLSDLESALIDRLHILNTEN